MPGSDTQPYEEWHHAGALLALVIAIVLVAVLGLIDLTGRPPAGSRPLGRRL